MSKLFLDTKLEAIEGLHKVIVMTVDAIHDDDILSHHEKAIVLRRLYAQLKTASVMADSGLTTELSRAATDNAVKIAKATGLARNYKIEVK